MLESTAFLFSVCNIPHNQSSASVLKAEPHKASFQVFLHCCIRDGVGRPIDEVQWNNPESRSKKKASKLRVGISTAGNVNPARAMGSFGCLHYTGYCLGLRWPVILSYVRVSVFQRNWNKQQIHLLRCWAKVCHYPCLCSEYFTVLSSSVLDFALLLKKQKHFAVKHNT